MITPVAIYITSLMAIWITIEFCQMQMDTLNGKTPYEILREKLQSGPSGIFAVETKARSKGSGKNPMDEAKVIYDGDRLRFPNWVTTEPIDQAKAQAAWLTKWLSSAVGDPVKVSPIVTIPGWFIDRKSPNGIPVLNPKQVKTYLEAKKEEVLSESMIKRICHHLEQGCRDVDLWDWY